MALAQEARDVLDHDDRIVDEQPERHHEADDRDLVQRVAEKIQRRKTDRERQRESRSSRCSPRAGRAAAA
jgi:hypothetical protein